MAGFQMAWLCTEKPVNNDKEATRIKELVQVVEFWFISQKYICSYIVNLENKI